MEMYVAPELEVLEVMVEQGFAGSGEGDGEFGDGPAGGWGWFAFLIEKSNFTLNLILNYGI